MTDEVSRTILLQSIFGRIDQLHIFEGGWTYDLYELEIQLVRVETI